MSRFSIAAAALILVASCSSPSPQYLGVKPYRVEVAGMVFDVYSNGVTAQAIRLDPGRPDFAIFGSSAIRAIEQATGCRVVDGSLGGDFVIAFVDLDCQV